MIVLELRKVNHPGVLSRRTPPMNVKADKAATLLKDKSIAMWISKSGRDHG
jgi:hypothetical protein